MSQRARVRLGFALRILSAIASGLRWWKSVLLPIISNYVNPQPTENRILSPGIRGLYAVSSPTPCESGWSGGTLETPPDTTIFTLDKEDLCVR